MRTVTFKSILRGVVMALGYDPDKTLDAAMANQVTEFVNNRLETGWKYAWWSEWTYTEQRQYRANYSSATAYAAPTLTAAVEVFFQASGKYYQALQATTGNAPATLTGGQYVENSAYFAECSNTYSGNDWATGTVFAVGDKARNPEDGRYYQCHTAHTAGGSFDATKFGVLTPFDPYIALNQTGLTAIAEVKQLSRRDPRVFPNNPYIVGKCFSMNGIQVTDRTIPNIVWVQFRPPSPKFAFVVWSATAAYVAGDIVYVSATGECYLALLSGTNQNPTTEATYWLKIDFPSVLANYVKRSALADCLRMSKQTSRANSEQAAALDELDEAATRDQESQGIYPTAEAVTYGS